MVEQLSKPSPRRNGAASTPEVGAPAVRSKRLFSAITSAVVVVALAVGAYALFRLDSLGSDQTEVAERFQLDLADYLEVPADMLGYVERSRISVALREPTAIALDAVGRIYVAGDQAIEVLDSMGKSTATIRLDDVPGCLAVAGPVDAHTGRVYVGLPRHVAVFGEQGELVQRWPQLPAKATLTAIAVSGDNVFVADAGQRVVLRYSADGQLLGTIGQTDPDRHMPGFVIPSAYFDLVADADEILHVVNPGMRRVEAYNFDGDLQSFWGQAGSALPGFFGCCNPAHLARLPDGRFITSEKGIPRIKVYSPEGDLQQVVAGPKQLNVSAAALGDARGNQKERVFDVAAAATGSVFVLDPHKRCVIVFEPRS